MNQSPLPNPNKPPEGSRVIYCETCQNRFLVDEAALLHDFLERRLVEALPGVIEFGLVCPGCKRWYSIGFTNKTLELARREAELTHEPRRRSSLRGKYSRRFKRFQEEIKARLAAAQTAPAEN